MEKFKINKSKIHTFFNVIFKLSFIYYLIWLIISIKYSIVGISSEYVGVHIESLCNHEHEMYYGSDGFFAGIQNFILFTIFFYWYVPLYQIIYLLVSFINKFIKKIKNKKEKNQNQQGENNE